MSLAWTRRWSRSANLPNAFSRSAGALFVLRDRGWITLSGAEPPTVHDRWGRSLRRLLQARNGALWAIDAGGALLRHDGHAWSAEGTVPAGDRETAMSIRLLLDCMARDGGPSLPNDASHVDVIHAGAVVRCTARETVTLWRGSTDAKVTFEGAPAPLSALVDGTSFHMIAVGSLPGGDALVVDHTGALVRITPGGDATCIRRGTVYRHFEHMHPDPDPDEITYPARAAVVAPDGTVWLARPGMEIERIADGVVQWLDVPTPHDLEALGVGADGTLWGIGASHRKDREQRGSGSLAALAGPRAGVRVSFEPPVVQGTIGVDAWLVEDADRPSVVRIDGEVSERAARAGELPAPRVTSIELAGVRWEADGRRLCVRGDEGLVAVAETEAPIRALVIDDAVLWVLTEASILRWNGAALVDVGGPSRPLRHLAVERGALLALSADHAFTATAPPLDPPIDPGSAHDLAVLERMLARALCPLAVTARPLPGRVISARTLAAAIGLPPLRGKWAEVPAPAGGAAIDRLWSGDETSPGLDDDLRVRLAGCFARAAEPASAWFVRAGQTRVHAVMVCTRGFALATWLVPDEETGPS